MSVALSLYLGVSYAALETRKDNTDSIDGEDVVLKISADYGPNTFVQGYYDGKRMRFFKFDMVDEAGWPGIQWTNKKGEYTGQIPNEVEQTGESLEENEEALGSMSMENPKGGKLLGVSYLISTPNEQGEKKVTFILRSTKEGYASASTHEWTLKQNPITKKWTLYNELEYKTGIMGKTRRELSRVEVLQFHIAGLSEDGARISNIFIEGENDRGDYRSKIIELKEHIPLNLEPDNKSSYCPPSSASVGGEVVDEARRVRRVFQAGEFI